jgi:putative peptidoglycan lipid II flippase
VAAGDVRRERLTQVSLTGTLLVVSMLLGLAGQALIAYFFGAGSRSDSLFLARDIGDLAAKALLTTQAVGVLVPFVVALRAREGPAASDRALAAVLTTVALAGTVLALLLAALAGPLVTLLAPGFDDATADRSVNLLRVIAPMAPFVAITALAVGALQARHRFGRAMTANLVGSAALLAAMPPLVHVWGISGAAAAMTVGAVASGVCAWVFLIVEGVPAALSPWRERAHVGEFVRRTTPFLSYAAATQGSGALLRIAASLLGAGLYAAFSLASRLFRAVVSLLVLPVQQVLLPALSHSEAGGRAEDSSAEIVATLRYAAFALVPVSVALFALSGRVVSVVFERGAFSAESADSTGRVLALFALAVLPTAAYTLLEQAAYARRLTPLIVRVNLGVEFIQGALYIPLVLALGAGGIPVAGLVVTLFATVVYLRRLKPSPLHIHLGFAARLVVCAAAMLVIVLATAALADALLDPGPGLAQLLVVVPACLAGTAVYLGGARIVGLQEPARLVEMVRAARAPARG